MAASNNSSTQLRGDSSTVIQGGSTSKRWNLKELEACGAVGTGISRGLTLTGAVHPVFANWTESLDPRLSRELKQPLLLATKLLDGTGLPWISDFIISDIFDESYPGRYSFDSGSGTPPASSSSSRKTSVQKHRPGTPKERPQANWHRLSRTTISNALKFSHEDEPATDTTPPLSPSASWSASSSDMSPRSSVTSSVHSVADSSSTATTSAASSNPHSRVTSLTLPISAPQQQTRGSGASVRHLAGHQKSASASILGSSVGERCTPLPAAGPETVFRHRRAPWWTRGLETKWLHRTDRWLRRELGPGLTWRLDTSGSGHICNNFLSNHGNPPATRRDRGDCYNVWLSSEFPERLAALRESGQLGSEEYICSAFMTCVAILHELGHAVYWQGFHAQSYTQQQFPSPSLREPYYGADLEMELGDSFVSSMFGGWRPVPIIMDAGNGIEAPDLAEGPSTSRYDTTSRYMIPRQDSSHSGRRSSSKLPRFDAGLAWRQTLSWDRHRIRPKHRAHYSIPLDHIALLYSQVSWDCCRDATKPASFLIHPIALVQDQTAALTNTVGLITNAAVLRREHACAALPDFVTAPHLGGGDGWLWKQDQRHGREFRIAQYNGRLRLELDLPVAAEGSIREALPVEEQQQPSSSLPELPARSRRGVAETLFAAEATVDTGDTHLENKLRSHSSAPVDRDRQHKNKQEQPIKTGDDKLVRLRLSGLLPPQQLSRIDTSSIASRNHNPNRSRSRGRTSTVKGDRLRIETGKDTQEYPERFKSAVAVNKALPAIPGLGIPLTLSQRQGLPQSQERRAVPPLPASAAAAIASATAAANAKTTQPPVKRSTIPVASRSGAVPPGSHTRSSSTAAATGSVRARTTVMGVVGLSSSPPPRPPSSAAPRTTAAATTSVAKIPATSRNSKTSTLDIKTKVVLSKSEKGDEEDIGPPPEPPMRSILRRSASARQLTRPRPPVSMPPMPVMNKAYMDAIADISTKNDTKTVSTTSSSHTSTAATPPTCQNSSSSASRRDRSSGKDKDTRSKSCGAHPRGSSSSRRREQQQQQHHCHDGLTRRAPPRPPPLPGMPDSFRSGGRGGAEGEMNVDELRARLTNMIDTSITELEWLYF